MFKNSFAFFFLASGKPYQIAKYMGGFAAEQSDAFRKFDRARQRHAIRETGFLSHTSKMNTFGAPAMRAPGAAAIAGTALVRKEIRRPH